MTDLAATPRAAVPAPRFLEDVYEATSLCNKCSLCQAVCPTYVVNPVEWESARGRISLIRDAMEGRIDLAELADGPLSTCLTCDNCMAACPPGVPTAAIVSRARQELSEQQGLSWGRRIALRGMFQSPAIMSFLHRLSRATQMVGLSAATRRGGFTRWMGTVGAVIDHIGPLERETAHHRAQHLPEAAQPIRGRVGFLVCCYQNVAAPQATEATMRVLLANGFEVVTPQLACSGLPARTLGDREAEIDIAAANLERLDGLQVDAFVGDVASCTAQWQRYGDLLETDRTANSARSMSRRTWLASDFLANAGITAEFGPLRWRVAIDEPCSLPLDAQVRSASRRLLAEIPRLEIIKLAEAEMCCGGPGVYFAEQPERSEAILRRKFDNVIASGCDVLVTENISCITQLRAGAARYAPHVRVMHCFEVMAASLDAQRRRTAQVPALAQRR